MSTWKIVALLIVLTFFGFRWWNQRPITHAPGVLVDSPPTQNDLSAPQPFAFRDYTITPLAEYSATALVLSKRNYYVDASAALSPVDLALGWGKMSDQSIIDQLEIRQSGRFYSFRPKSSGSGFPYAPEELLLQSANTHFIPADREVAKALSKVRQGHIIDFKGFLVQINRSSDGFNWRSLLSTRAFHPPISQSVMPNLIGFLRGQRLIELLAGVKIIYSLYDTPRRKRSRTLRPLCFRAKCLPMIPLGD